MHLEYFDYRSLNFNFFSEAVKSYAAIPFLNVDTITLFANELASEA